MMEKKLIFLLVPILLLLMHGVTIADGGPGLQVPPPDPRQDPNVVGAYIKGYFTIAYDKANPNQYTHHNVHAVLEWTNLRRGVVNGIERSKPGRINLKKLRPAPLPEKKVMIPLKETHLFSATVNEPNSKNLCEYTENELIQKYWDLPNQLQIPEGFGVQNGKAYLTQLKIINKDFCGNLSVQEPKAMIHGEVEIFLYKTIGGP